MARILVCDPLVEEGLAILREAGEVVVATGLSEEELIATVGGFDAIVVRSGTQLTAPVLEAATCQVIARAGVGVDNIDVEAATRQGILVVNSPAGNILAAAEHAVALLLSATRLIPQANASIKSGQWDRKSFHGRQLEGKTLGLIGLGKVGSAVARRGHALGMKVIAYDPFLKPTQAAEVGAELMELSEVLAQSDFLSLHAVAHADNRHLLGAAEFAQVRPGLILVNAARGALLDEAALLEALDSGQVSVAALDVFADEPCNNRALLDHPQVIATPHIGALTQEAQLNVALDAARQVVEVLGGRPPRWPVNVPSLGGETTEAIASYVPLAQALGVLARSLTPGPLNRVELAAAADLSPNHLAYLTATALAPLLSGMSTQPVNTVNAPLLARERRIEVAQAHTDATSGYTNLLQLTLVDDETTVVSGAVLENDQTWIVGIDGYTLDLPPEGVALLTWRREARRPGFVGSVGLLLGEAGVSISAIQVSRELIDSVGLMAVTVTPPVPDEVLQAIGELDGVIRTLIVDFTGVTPS